MLDILERSLQDEVSTAMRVIASWNRSFYPVSIRWLTFCIFSSCVFALPYLWVLRPRNWKRTFYEEAMFIRPCVHVSHSQSTLWTSTSFCIQSCKANFILIRTGTLSVLSVCKGETEFFVRPVCPKW